uniref:Uncharacterized protein n=1 Tax=Rhizobium loti TaxID=381 RepID=Q8KGR9_RHILI|nr:HYPOTHETICAL PROTEIN [Mesorhizobium japonicum R7A]
MAMNRSLARHLRRFSSDELKPPADGIFEPRCSVLDKMKQGDPIGILHPMDTLSAGSIDIRARATLSVAV